MAELTPELTMFLRRYYQTVEVGYPQIQALYAKNCTMVTAVGEKFTDVSCCAQDAALNVSYSCHVTKVDIKRAVQLFPWEGGTILEASGKLTLHDKRWKFHQIFVICAIDGSYKIKNSSLILSAIGLKERHTAYPEGGPVTEEMTVGDFVVPDKDLVGASAGSATEPLPVVEMGSLDPLTESMINDGWELTAPPPGYEAHRSISEQYIGLTLEVMGGHSVDPDKDSVPTGEDDTESVPVPAGEAPLRSPFRPSYLAMLTKPRGFELAPPPPGEEETLKKIPLPR